MRALNGGGIRSYNEKTRIEEVKQLIAQGINPLTVSINAGGGAYKLTADDLANFVEFYGVPFGCTLSCFGLKEVGKDVERQELSQ